MKDVMGRAELISYYQQLVFSTGITKVAESSHCWVTQSEKH